MRDTIEKIKVETITDDFFVKIKNKLDSGKVEANSMYSINQDCCSNAMT